MVSIEKKTLHCDQDSNLKELELGSLYSTIPLITVDIQYHKLKELRDVKVGKAFWDNSYIPFCLRINII